MFQWLRLPDADADLTASTDTTEVQIGTGVKVPNWAKSIIGVYIAPRLLALTTNEEVCGYLRLNNDENSIEPFYLPLPISQCLTGAIGTHITEPLISPCELDVTPNDTVRAYSALDATTTGAHTLAAYLLFSSRVAKYKMHAQTATIQTLSTSSVTRPTAKTISTIAGKTNGLIGFWGYMVAGGGITAAQSVQGYALVESNALGWLPQRFPLNQQASGLSTQITPYTKPVFAVHESYYNELKQISGASVLQFPDIFPVNTAQEFTFYGMTDGANTAAPTARYGVIFKE